MDQTQKLRDLAISDSGFVFDPYTGLTYSVNAVGRTMLECIKDGLGRAAIFEAITDAFEVDPHRDMDRDLDEFLHLLRSNGLVPQGFLVEP